MDFQNVDEFTHLVWQKDSSKVTSRFNGVIFTDDQMLAVTDGNYHCSCGNNPCFCRQIGAIILYDTTGNEIRTTEPSQLYHPINLSYIPKDNRLIIPDGNMIDQVVYSSLQKMSPFEIQHTSGIHDPKIYFHGITMMKSDKIAISSYGKHTMGYVHIVNYETGNIIKTMPGDDAQEILHKPMHLHTNSEGHLLVLDYRQNCIKVFDNSGEYIKTLPVNYPRGLCTDEEDNIIVVHDADKNIHPQCDSVSVLSHQDGHLLKTLVTIHHNDGGWLRSVALKEKQMVVVAERRIMMYELK